LDLGQVIVRAWDIPGYTEMSQALAITCPRSKYNTLGHLRISQDVPGYSLDYFDLGQVIVRAWDITGFPEMSQGILGTTWTWDK